MSKKKSMGTCACTLIPVVYRPHQLKSGSSKQVFLKVGDRLKGYHIKKKLLTTRSTLQADVLH